MHIKVYRNQIQNHINAFRISRIRITGLFLIFFLFFSVPDLLSLDPDRRMNQYVLDEWNLKNNFHWNSVVAITQSGDGNLWFATKRVLCRYDGKKFSSFREILTRKTEYNQITCLNVDSRGTLWGGTHGKGVFRLVDDPYRIYTGIKGLPGHHVNCLYSDIRGNLWIGLNQGRLYTVTDLGDISVSPMKMKLEHPVISILQDSKGNFWVGTKNGGLFRIEKGNFVKLASPLSPMRPDIYSMVESHGGDIWFATNRGLLRYNGKEFKVYGPKDGISSDNIRTIIQDSDQNLWVGTINGLYRIILKPGDHIQVEGMFSGCVINCLFEDREKSVWIGTNGHGLKRLTDSRMTMFSVEDGLPHDYVISQYEDSGGCLWVGTMNGLVRFQRAIISKKTRSTVTLNKMVGPICEDRQGSIFYGTLQGEIFKVEKKIRVIPYIRETVLAGTAINALIFDKRNRMWIGTRKGLFSHDKNQLTFFSSKDGLLSNSIRCLYEDSRSRLWIGTSKGLNTRYENRFTNPLKKFDIGDFRVSSIYEDQEGILWVSTRGYGILKLKMDGLEVFTTRNGLYSNYAYQVLEDKRGYLWISSDKGIFKLKKEDFIPSPDLRHKLEPIVYGKEEGMRSEECSQSNQASSIKLKKGILLFGTPRGIAMIDPDNLKISRTLISVQLYRIIINDTLISRDQQEINDSRIRYMMFCFRSLSLLKKNRVKFKYILRGYEKEWNYIKPTQAKIAHYEDIPPGKYSFTVIACNNDGIWNSRGDTYSFRFKPYFYHTSWFKMTVLVLGLLIAGSILTKYKAILKYYARKKRYRDSILEPAVVDRCVKELKRLFEVERIFLDENLSLQSLAEILKINPNVLSRIINEQKKKHFTDFVNHYRIEEAKRRLVTIDLKEKSILSIAYDVGFKSKSAFYDAFKKFTKMTPLKYINVRNAK